MYRNVLELLEKHAVEVPDQLSYSEPAAGYTYKELLDASKSVGTYLSSRIAPGSAVFVYMKKSADMFPAFWGSVYAGCFYVPIDDKMPVDRIRTILDIMPCAAIICDNTTEEKANQLGCDHVIVMSDNIKNTEPDETGLSAIRKSAIDTDPLYVLFTSGSTGKPKGVVVCHRSVIAYAGWVCSTFSIDHETVFGNQTPFYFSMSVLDIYATLYAGATLYIIPKMLFSFPVRLLELLNDKKINTVYWVPSALCIVANLGAFDEIRPEYLKKVLFAGEVMPTKQLNIWRKHLPDALYANLFGPTEITDIGVYYVVDREFPDDEPIPIGRNCDNVGLLVVSESGEQATEDKVGELGELYIRGTFLALGYYNDPEKTAEAFVQNPLQNAYPETVYRTGDLVYWNDRGELVFSSRKDFQIKHMGNRIELGEIEVALSAQDGIDTCCCLYDTQNKQIVAFYSGSRNEEELHMALSKKVPAYMLPGVYKHLDGLPHNMNGKIDRKELQNMI